MSYTYIHHHITTRPRDAVRLFEKALLFLPESKFIRKKLAEAQAQAQLYQSKGGLEYALDFPDSGDAWKVMKQEVHPVEVSALLSNQNSEFAYNTCPSDLRHEPTNTAERDFIRFVCISDTHGMHHKLTPHLPQGDVLLHAGDFTQTGELNEVEDFGSWFESLPHTHKIVVAGNHEVTFHTSHYDRIYDRLWSQAHTTKYDSAKCRAALTTKSGVTYLEDEAAEIAGVKVYGSPWQPKFCEGWGYNLSRGSECRMKWDRIPKDTHILLTHTPPVGHGDLTSSRQHVGCVDLLQTVQQQVRPLFNIFGHIHSAYGVTRDQQTTYINAASCDSHYAPIQPPIVFDLKREDLERFQTRFAAQETGDSGSSGSCS